VKCFPPRRPWVFVRNATDVWEQQHLWVSFPPDTPPERVVKQG